MDKKLDDLVISLKDEMVNSISESIKIKSVRENPVEEGPFGEGIKKSREHTVKLA